MADFRAMNTKFAGAADAGNGNSTTRSNTVREEFARMDQAMAECLEEYRHLAERLENGGLLFPATPASVGDKEENLPVPLALELRRRTAGWVNLRASLIDLLERLAV